MASSAQRSRSGSVHNTEPVTPLRTLSFDSLSPDTRVVTADVGIVGLELQAETETRQVPEFAPLPAFASIGIERQPVEETQFQKSRTAMKKTHFRRESSLDRDVIEAARDRAAIGFDGEILYSTSEHPEEFEQEKLEVASAWTSGSMTMPSHLSDTLRSMQSSSASGDSQESLQLDKDKARAQSSGHGVTVTSGEAMAPAARRDSSRGRVSSGGEEMAAGYRRRRMSQPLLPRATAPAAAIKRSESQQVVLGPRIHSAGGERAVKMEEERVADLSVFVARSHSFFARRKVPGTSRSPSLPLASSSSRPRSQRG